LFILLQQVESGGGEISGKKSKSKATQVERKKINEKFARRSLLPKGKVIKHLVIILCLFLVPLITLGILPYVNESSQISNRVKGISNVAYLNEQAFLNVREAFIDSYSTDSPRCNATCLSYLDNSKKYLEPMWDTYKKSTYGDEELGVRGLLSGAENEGVIFESFFGDSCSVMDPSIIEEYSAQHYCENFDDGVMKNGLSSSISTYYTSMKALISNLKSSTLSKEKIAKDIAYLEVLSLLICMVCDVISAEAQKPLDGLLFMNNMVILPLEYVISFGLLLFIYQRILKDYIEDMERKAKHLHLLLMTFYTSMKNTAAANEAKSVVEKQSTASAKMSSFSIIKTNQYQPSVPSSKTSKKRVDAVSGFHDEKNEKVLVVVESLKEIEDVKPEEVTRDEENLTSNSEDEVEKLSDDDIESDSSDNAL
jgi:hypothetical protein